MRKLLLSLILLLPLLALPLGAQAAEHISGSAADGWSDTPVAASAYSEAAEEVADTQAQGARDCCHQIIERCHTVKPKCITLCHKCATPYKPCAPCLPELSGCHKPVTPYMPCAPCLPELCTCHKPAVVVKPEVCCDCRIELTGSRELIAPDAGCECGCHEHSGWAD